MHRQSLRQTIVFAVLLTAAWGGVLLFTEKDMELGQLAFRLPLFLVIIFATMRLSNRVMTRLFPAPKAPLPPPPTPPSTERPVHAQRRRRPRPRHRRTRG